MDGIPSSSGKLPPSTAPSEPVDQSPTVEKKLPKSQGITPPNTLLSEWQVKTLAPVAHPALATASNPPLNPVFVNHCHQIAEKYLLVPFPGEIVLDGEIARPLHGVQHSTRGILHLLYLIELHKSWGNPHALSVTDEDIQGLIVAFILHDSGRKGDFADKPEWEKESSTNCFRELSVLGFSEARAAMFADCIAFKDKPGRFSRRWGEKNNFLRSLIHDTDTLEVIRVRTHFMVNRLEIYQQNKDNPQRDKELLNLAENTCRVISKQGDMSYPTTIASPRWLLNRVPRCKSQKDKLTYEKAENCIQRQFDFFKTHCPEMYQFSGIDRLASTCNASVDSVFTIAIAPTTDADFSQKHPDTIDTVFQFQSYGVVVRSTPPGMNDEYFQSQKKEQPDPAPVNERRPVSGLKDGLKTTLYHSPYDISYIFDPDLLTPWATYKRSARTRDFTSTSDQWHSPVQDLRALALDHGPDPETVEALADQRYLPQAPSETERHRIKRLNGFPQLFEKLNERNDRLHSLDAQDYTSGSWHKQGKAKKQFRLSEQSFLQISEVVCESIDPAAMLGILHHSDPESLHCLGKELAELKVLKHKISQWCGSSPHKEREPVMLVYNKETGSLLEAGTFDEMSPPDWQNLPSDTIKEIWATYYDAFKKSCRQLNQGFQKVRVADIMEEKIQLLPIKDRIELLRRNHLEQSKENGKNLFQLYLEIVQTPPVIADPDNQEETMKTLTMKYGFTSRSLKQIDQSMVKGADLNKIMNANVTAASRAAIASEALAELLSPTHVLLSDKESYLLSYAQLMAGLLPPEEAAREFATLFKPDTAKVSQEEQESVSAIYTALRSLCHTNETLPGRAKQFRQLLLFGQSLGTIPPTSTVTDEFPTIEEMRAWGIPEQSDLHERVRHLCHGLVDLSEVSGGMLFNDQRTEPFQRFDQRHKLGSLEPQRSDTGAWTGSPLNQKRHWHFSQTPCCWKRLKEQIDENAIRDLVGQSGQKTDNTGKLKGTELPYDMPLSERLSVKHPAVKRTLSAWRAHVRKHGTPGLVGTIDPKDVDRKEVIEHVEAWEVRFVPDRILENYISPWSAGHD